MNLYVKNKCTYLITFIYKTCISNSLRMAELLPFNSTRKENFGLSYFYTKLCHNAFAAEIKENAFLIQSRTS